MTPYVPLSGNSCSQKGSTVFFFFSFPEVIETVRKTRALLAKSDRLSGFSGCCVLSSGD